MSKISRIVRQFGGKRMLTIKREQRGRISLQLKSNPYCEEQLGSLSEALGRNPSRDEMIQYLRYGVVVN